MLLRREIPSHPHMGSILQCIMSLPLGSPPSQTYLAHLHREASRGILIWCPTISTGSFQYDRAAVPLPPPFRYLISSAYLWWWAPCTNWHIWGNTICAGWVPHRGGRVVQWLALHSKKVLGLCGFHTFSPCLHGFPPGALTSSHSLNTCRLIGDSKLPVDVNVSVNGHFSLCFSPVMNWWPVQDVPDHRPCKGLEVIDMHV